MYVAGVENGVLNTGQDNPDKIQFRIPTKDTTAQMRISIYIPTDNSGPGSYDFAIGGELEFGPQKDVPGYIASYLGDIGCTTTQTNVTLTTQSWRDGDSLLCYYKLVYTGVPVGNADVVIPYTIDTVKGNGLTSGDLVQGISKYLDSGVDEKFGPVRYNTSNSIRPMSTRPNSSASNAIALISTTNFPLTSGDQVDGWFRVPIAEWKATNLISTTENLFRNQQTKIYRNSALNFGSGLTKINFDTVAYDNLGVADLTNDRITVNEDGLYWVTYRAAWTGVATAGLEGRIYKNGAEFIRIGDATSATTKRIDYSEPLYLNKGDYIECWVNHGDASFDITSGQLGNSFSITSIKDTSVFSVYGESEVLEASAGFAAHPAVAGWRDLASLPLNPGEYDIFMQATYLSNGATTTTTIALGGSNVSATDPGTDGNQKQVDTKNQTTGTFNPMNVHILGYKVNANEDFYLKTFAAGSVTNLEIAYKISARKVK